MKFIPTLTGDIAKKFIEQATINESKPKKDFSEQIKKLEKILRRAKL